MDGKRREFRRQRSYPALSAMGSWVFIPGVVFTDPDRWPDGAVAEVIDPSIDEFCQSNPDATIAAAAVAFVRKHQH